MDKNWAIKEQPDAELITRLTKEINTSSVLSTLLVQRGIHDFSSAKDFFRPDLGKLHDPFLMKDMEKAVNRILKAIEEGESILVFGDYDVDGTTAVAMMYSFLAEIHPDLSYYIPDRYAEGYGISIKGIDWAADNGYSLIISLDCGIKAIDKVAYANEKNIDFIICDHHLPGDELPQAFAILDPKRKDCNYPYKELSGCGVGFKLIQALAKAMELDESICYNYLDLVAVSIAADIVDITGENRVLAHFGIQKLNEDPRPGIKTILEMTQVTKKLSISDIVFTIGPRINAAGRIESGTQAVQLLVAEDDESAHGIASLINKHNDERRVLDSSITEEALEFLANSDTHPSQKTTVVYNPNWHKGVIGIVASRLVDKFYRPTIVLTNSNGHVAGSARSVKEFDIYSAIEACSDLLEQFGGHKFAAGLTMKPENVEAFMARFEEVVSSTITDEMLVQQIEIDAELELQQITPKFFEVLKQLGPFGPGNMKPVFISRNVSDRGFAKVVGENHLKLTVGQRTGWYDAIGFQLAKHYEDIAKRKVPFHICYTLEENAWNGQVNMQLNVKDIKIAED